MPMTTRFATIWIIVTVRAWGDTEVMSPKPTVAKIVIVKYSRVEATHRLTEPRWIAEAHHVVGGREDHEEQRDEHAERFQRSQPRVLGGGNRANLDDGEDRE